MAERADLVLYDAVLVPGGAVVDIAVTDGRISAVSEALALECDLAIDLGAAFVTAGFIDLQVNGGYGADITDDPASMWALGERLRTHGVTAFLPTLVSTELEQIDHARDVVAAGPPDTYTGATVLGLHVEGPFLSPHRNGAHDPDLLRLPSPDLVAGWGDSVRLVTLAPELPGALETVDALLTDGIVVSAGHSDATYDEAVAGFDRGIRMVTHLFNAMSGMDHRRPGLAAAALADDRVTAGLILDLIHVHPGAVRAAWAALGESRLLLVTDIAAVAGAGTAPGLLGGREVTTVDGAPRLASGTLAGSVLTLDAAVRNHVEVVDAGLEAAIASVTTVPADLMGIDRRLTVGAPADLTVLDEELAVVATVVDGNWRGEPE